MILRETWAEAAVKVLAKVVAHAIDEEHLQRCATLLDPLPDTPRKQAMMQFVATCAVARQEAKDFK